MPAEVVTSENLAEYNAARMPPQESEEPKAEEPKDETKAKATEEEHEDDGEEGKQEEAKPRRKPGLEGRFSEITAKQRAAEARAEAAEAREREKDAKLRELEERLSPKPKADPDSGKPKREEYTDPFDYAEKLSEWNVKKELTERDAREAKNKADAEAAKTAKAFQDRIAKAKEAIPDFDEVLQSSDLKVSDDVRDAIIESDLGPEILHHLALNPDLAEKINGMNTKQALREIGRLEVRLEPKEETSQREAKPAAKRETLPEPIVPVKSKATGHEDDLEGLSYAEFKAKEQARLNRKK